MKRVLSKVGMGIAYAVVTVVLVTWWVAGPSMFTQPFGWLHLPKDQSAAQAQTPSPSGSESEPAPTPSSSESEPTVDDETLLQETVKRECGSIWANDPPLYRECAIGMISGAVVAWNPKGHAWVDAAWLAKYKAAVIRNAKPTHPKVMGLGVDTGAQWAKQARWQPDAHLRAEIEAGS